MFFIRRHTRVFRRTISEETSSLVCRLVKDGIISCRNCTTGFIAGTFERLPETVIMGLSDRLMANGGE
jgi:hypothetical protein